MTKQELFNQAIKGLAAQGFQRAMGLRGVCEYRAPEGRKCFVGQLIPDDKYTPAMDQGEEYSSGVGVDALLERFPFLEPALLADDEEDGDASRWLFLAQRVHDAHANPADMRDGYREFAAAHNLTLPPELQ